MIYHHTQMKGKKMIKVLLKSQLKYQCRPL